MWVGTARGMHYVDDEDREAYCFTLTRLVGDDPVDLDECVIGSVQVVAEEQTVEQVKPGMRGWALATLAAGRYGFGRYEVAMGVRDRDGDLDERFGHEVIDWDGDRELIPAGG